MDKIKYELLLSKRKTSSIHINKNGEVIVKAPLKACVKQLDIWVQSKTAWINKHKQRIQNRNQHQNDYTQNCDYAINSPIPYMGGLIYLKSNDESKIISFDGRNLYINPNQDIKNQVEKWYKDEAKKTYINLLNYWKIKMEVNFSNFKIGHGKRRLGFCNSKAEICISWYLIMQPLYVIEYVIVHELAHLIHFNHSPLFWHLVNHHYPNYVKAEDYLKNRGMIFL